MWATPQQAPILANLLQLYAHDFSELIDLELGSDGRFGYEQLPLYWTEAGRHPLLITADGRWAGFALVKRGSEVAGVSAGADVWDMTEFFIVRGRRRSGLGMAAAHAVWRRFPGAWEVRVRERNLAAVGFWQRTVETFVGASVAAIPFESEGEPWRVFCFVSAAAGPLSGTSEESV